MPFEIENTVRPANKDQDFPVPSGNGHYDQCTEISHLLQSIIMASPLIGLPDELLLMVLLKVPKKDTKAARLTCTRLAGIGAHYLFQRIYFAPRRKVMEDFKCITSNPIFCKSVEELVYDSRLFIDYEFHEGNPWECASKCTRKTTPVKGCGWEAMYLMVSGSKDVVALARKYNGFYADQQAISENGDDFHLLCEGLHRMPKISTLTLWDDFRYDPDCRPAFTYAHDWYRRRTLKEFGISIHPSHCITTNDLSQARDDETINSCDVRGVAGLYEALASANAELLKLLRLPPRRRRVASSESHYASIPRTSA